VVTQEELKARGYQHLETAIHTTEPSVVVGSKLRSKFLQYLRNSTVKLNTSTTVAEIHKNADGTFLVRLDDGAEHVFDGVVNATSYQHFLPKHSKDPVLPACLPFEMQIVYQPCVAVVYEDTQEKERGKLNPFIVMDGWFPCVMSYDDNEEKTGNSKYIVIHGKWTILGSCASQEEAHALLWKAQNNPVVETTVEAACRADVSRFWPEFNTRFKHIKTIGTVLVKIATDKEYRSAVTFSEENGIVHIIPGKINNIFDVGREVSDLLTYPIGHDAFLYNNGYRYVKGGALDRGRAEITEKPIDKSRNTCSLQTAQEIISNTEVNQPKSQFFAGLPTQSSVILPFPHGTKRNLFFEATNVVPSFCLTTESNKELTSVNIVTRKVHG
jgi:hypothetical protein